MLLNWGVGEDSWKSLGLPLNPKGNQSWIFIQWKDWWWSWNSNNLANWCKELTHWKRPWCWARLKAGGEGDDRGWDGWMASPTWVGEGQGSLACYSPWGRKESDTAEWLNWTETSEDYRSSGRGWEMARGAQSMWPLVRSISLELQGTEGTQDKSAPHKHSQRYSEKWKIL